VRSKPRAPRAPGEVDRRIGALIREARRARAVPREDLAAGVGVRATQIGKYETGMNRVPAGRLWAIAGFLDVPIESLFPPRA